ncbi:TPA: PLP-dependent aminotransferase family protein [Klebsiella michiganensis]
MKINTFTIVFVPGEKIYRQLYKHIKSGIDSGRYSSGDKLPSTRHLATELGISRTSVLNAYNELIATGYLISQKGSGYEVNSVINTDIINTEKSKKIRLKYKKEKYTPFNTESMDMSFFPAYKMAKIISKVGRKKPLSLIYTDQYDKFGSQDLRNEICNYVYEKKGINCSLEQVIITSGSLESFEMCINILTEPGQTVSLEAPCFSTHIYYLKNNGRNVRFLQVDREGACCNDISTGTKFVFITPECQYPFGMIMSNERKNDFIQWASDNCGWIIEDDFDSNSVVNNRHEPTIFSYDKNHRTLYFGNFSQVIERALNIGYIILPKELISFFRKTEYVPKVSYLPQLIMAEFIKSGDFYRNLLKARKICSEKRHAFVNMLKKYLSVYGNTIENNAGSVVVFILNAKISDATIASSARLKGVNIKILSSIFHDIPLNGFIFGFIHFNKDELKKSVIILRDICALYCQQNCVDLTLYSPLKEYPNNDVK